MSGAAPQPAAAQLAGPQRVKDLIPHRFPILLVDRVDEVQPGERIVTRKAVSVNEPWYQSLPDDTPDAGYAYPVPLLIESWCQSAALLTAWDQDPAAAEGQVALFGGMSGIEVVGQVLPGDVLLHEVRINRAFAGTWFFDGATTTACGREVLRVDSVMTAMRPSSVLAPPAEGEQSTEAAGGAGGTAAAPDGAGGAHGDAAGADEKAAV